MTIADSLKSCLIGRAAIKVTPMPAEDGDETFVGMVTEEDTKVFFLNGVLSEKSLRKD